jgi:hypothetical protein
MSSATRALRARLSGALCLVWLPVALSAQAWAREPAVRRPRGTIAVGATARDTLRRGDLLLPAESSYAQEWKLPGVAGETVTIDLASDAFDAYAFLFGPGFPAALPQDDDSGGKCNARLTVRLPQSGDYYIVVTSRDKFATGPFTLSVAPGSKPTSLVRCNR